MNANHPVSLTYQGSPVADTAYRLYRPFNNHDIYRDFRALQGLNLMFDDSHSGCLHAGLAFSAC